MAKVEPRKLTIPEFLAFYEARPDEERWQLVDGVALLMTPPYPAHQRIASNLERLLNDALEQHVPHLLAYQRIGIELPNFPHYRPEPDVAVVDLALEPGRRFFDRFYLAAEIISKSDEAEERLPLKRGFYRGHEHCRAILIVQQDRPSLEVDRRDHRGEWRTEHLDSADADLVLPEFGLSCRVRDLYRNTRVIAP